MNLIIQRPIYRLFQSQQLLFRVQFNNICGACSELPEGVDRTLKHSIVRLGIIGVPFSKGNTNKTASGVELGPTAIRNFGLFKEIAKLGHDVVDYGNISCEGENGLKNGLNAPLDLHGLPDLSHACEVLSKRVEDLLKEKRKVLILGGDHSIALGSVDGHLKAKKGKVCVLWIDAHPDINTAYTSDTGNMHGMAVSLLVKELTNYWPYLPGLDWQEPTMSIKNLAYIGLRSVDQYERLIIEKHGVCAFGMEDIDKYGIQTVTKLALEKINPKGDRSLHVSFDIDALDTLEAPCTGTPVRGGLTLREALYILEIAYQTGWLSVLDLVEVNPGIGTPQQLKITLEAAISIIKAAFGHRRSGYVPKHINNLPGLNDSIKTEDIQEKQKLPSKISDLEENKMT